MKLILVRHGETEANSQEIIQGWSDSKLSKRGREQIRRLAERLKNEKIDVIYSSDLGRAVNTAKEILKFHNVELILDKRLRERSWGVFDGKKYREADSVLNKNGAKWYDEVPEGGESREESIRRMFEFLEEALTKFSGKTVLAISHGGVLKRFLNELLNDGSQNPDDFFHKNTGVTYLEKQADGWKAIKINCTEHLK